MSSRGSKAKNGHVTTTEYEEVKVLPLNIKVLKGIGICHSLPDYAHTPSSIYAKIKSDGKTLHEMRFYNEQGEPIIEIAYHPEPKINNGNRNDVVHFHSYNGLDRMSAKRMQDYPDVKEKYAEYLKELDLYDKC